MNNTPTAPTENSNGRLLALLSASFYTLFTLLPDSSSLMVAWPWVFIWQVGLLCAVFWFLSLLATGKLTYLGNNLDWCVAITIIGLIISTVFAQFPNQALWYSWSVLCLIAALYALNSRLNTPQNRYRLLIFQGYLNLTFIIISLFLWTTQTLLPELANIKTLNQYGVNFTFDFSVLELRNWAPLGHQNYVAGYLLLSLPLLVGLSILPTGKQRWVWIIGVVLGLINLYTTSSRGGWLGFLVLFIVALIILLFRSSLPRLWLALGGIATLGVIISLILTNNRLARVITAILKGEGGGELGYRIINAATGWKMGITHPFSGVGLGGVPLLYQKYRPLWAGQESELIYQLHSTPFHLWAEMGIWAIITIILFCVVIALAINKTLLVRGGNTRSLEHTDKIFLWSIAGSFLAYSVMSLTDFQLDNIAISGTLIIFIATLASILRMVTECSGSVPYPRQLALAGLGLVLAVIIWLIPIHRAWQLSSQAFMALWQEEPDFPAFVQFLTRASELTPWESYYPYQLGWKLGDLALQKGDSQLLTESIYWLKKGIEASPYQEFGHSNLGWLLLNNNPKAAMTAFATSAQLVPAKKGVFFGLGLSLLAQNQVDLAVEAMSLEILRDPLFITSPIWSKLPLKSIFPQVTERILAVYEELIKQQPNNLYWQNAKSGLYWWLGNIEAARADNNSLLSAIILDLAVGKEVTEKLSKLEESAEKLVITAWLNPQQRQELLQQAWILEMKTPLPDNIQQELLIGMENADNFDQWLKEKAPVWQYRRGRSGFGVVSRHIDGVAPTDFWVVTENVAMSNWLAELLPSPEYDPELDLALQPLREKLLLSL
ncbi:MAG: O-antigen ligase family protein [Gomphosphaeria aponina SAG 52.96 = DSM 107014]|uniref:O-antigen ligase family protein n=1 Tax=Gomphosphaeria aponina SAG 52.96 = DSM 107014 TaxID=1521640 RepID=A0A941GUF4_9CHRO|nr:O-antigen ligase family protein [Gomphosphaeria aponina SAG 52.96 = DSM 107014]